MTQQEWIGELIDIIDTTYDLCPDKSKFGEITFMYDNPSFHRLTEDEKLDILQETMLESVDQLQNPPRYSGDFMQCIEHVHGYICGAWANERLADGHKKTWQEHEADLRRIFNEKVTAENVTANVHKLVKLLERIKKDGTGGYAPSALT